MVKGALTKHTASRRVHAGCWRSRFACALCCCNNRMHRHAHACLAYTPCRLSNMDECLNALLAVLKRRHPPGETWSRVQRVLIDLALARKDEKERMDNQKLEALAPLLTGANPGAAQAALVALATLAHGGSSCICTLAGHLSHFANPQALAEQDAGVHAPTSTLSLKLCHVSHAMFKCCMCTQALSCTCAHAHTLHTCTCTGAHMCVHTH